MFKTVLIIMACLCLFMGTGARADEPVVKDLRQAVEETERAFADTMARRDFEAFQSFLSDEAIFFSGSTALRGRQQIAAAWEGYFKEPLAPFSWQPEQVEVLDSGTLALSSGPVLDAEGKQIARFNSVWRLDESQKWHIIFDKGSEVCNTP